MIHTNRIVTVGEQESIIDRPIVLYRGDREVEIEFTLVGNEFTFSEEGNVIKSVNASHGQLVLNTPSGEHMFSELAECHEGKVVFVVTKEMIDEFIEMGFYSFQIRLYDSAEMKSRVTIPPVMNGFDIRNPIAAEDETNVVDQGIVDYARIFKDQSNEELPTFDWQGNYNKTEWVHHDVITENKMNKIEDALYSINANIKESDVVMLNTLNQVKKDADKYVKEHMAEVETDVEEFERVINTRVERFKIDTNAAMTAHKNEVSEELESVNSQLADIQNRNVKIYKSSNLEDNTIELQELINSFEKGGKILFETGTFMFKGTIHIPKNITIEGAVNANAEPNSSSTHIIHDPTVADTDLFVFEDKQAYGGLSGISIRNLCIKGNSNSRYCFDVAYGNELVVENIVTEGFVDVFKLSGLIHSNFRNLKLRNPSNSGMYFCKPMSTSSVFENIYITGTNTCMVAEHESCLDISINLIILESSDYALKIASGNYIDFYSPYLENIPRTNNDINAIELGFSEGTLGGTINFIGGSLAGSNYQINGTCINADNIEHLNIIGSTIKRYSTGIKTTNNCKNINLIGVTGVQVPTLEKISNKLRYCCIGCKSGSSYLVDSLPSISINNGRYDFRQSINNSILEIGTSSGKLRLDSTGNVRIGNPTLNSGFSETICLGENSVIGTGTQGYNALIYATRVDGVTMPTVRLSSTYSNVFQIARAGSTASRPTAGRYVGMEVFDTTLKKPIWWDGTKWVDATGADV